MPSVNLAKPSHELYGIFPQAYAQSLLASTGDPTADAINRLTLGMHARTGAGSAEYLAALREANQLEVGANLRLADSERAGKLDEAFVNNAAGIGQRGYLRAIRPGPNSNIQLDPNAIAEGDAVITKGVQAQTLENAGTGVKALADAGQSVNSNYLSGLFADPREETPPQIAAGGYITPADKEKLLIENKKADAETIKAGAAVIAANKKGSSGNSTDDTDTEDFSKATGQARQGLATYEQRLKAYLDHGGSIVRKEPNNGVVIRFNGKLKRIQRTGDGKYKESMVKK